MKALELVASSDWEITNEGFKLKKSNIVWESAHYSNVHKIVIQRVVPANNGGKPFLMGLNYKQRYIDPETEIILIPRSLKQKQ